MKKGFSFLIAIGVCALMQVGASAAETADIVIPFSVKAAAATETLPSDTLNSSAANLSTQEIIDDISAAKQLLAAHANLSGGKSVSLAVLDPQTSQLHVVTIDKDSFLKKDATLVATSQLGSSLSLTVVRPNGVNTAVTATDVSSGRALTPLMVAYPIVKDGTVTEVAYYASAHPALLSPEVSSVGESYVDTMLDKAADSLANKGVHIPDDIVDVAEHLCVVEHTDHKRFATENHSQLFPEILSLYALNQGNTFRYSVSTAGAGGMIQMIPRTYEGIRQQHVNVPLQTDFVSGMRDHGNALEAMLLYMNDTWNKLAESSEVQDALRSGIATKPELLAAGYNSNPGRLPSYLKTGGANWRTLIPAETQIYLSIYSEVDKNVKFDQNKDEASNSTMARDGSSLSTPNAPAFVGWFADLLESSGQMFQRILR